MRWGACDWETVERTNKEPLETGRRTVRRLRVREDTAGNRAQAGKGESQRAWEEEMEEKAWDGLKTAAANTHQSPEGDRTGGGGQPQTPAGPAVSKCGQAKPQRQQPDSLRRGGNG